MLLFDNSYGKAFNTYWNCNELNNEVETVESDDYDDYLKYKTEEIMYVLNMPCPQEINEMFECVCCLMKQDCLYDRSAA